MNTFGSQYVSNVKVISQTDTSHIAFLAHLDEVEMSLCYTPGVRVRVPVRVRVRLKFLG